VGRLLARPWIPIAALWLGLGGCLAILTTRVADWYVMTDELLYERLAISVGQQHSPLPHVHGELIANVNQLYPLLLAPLFAGKLVPDGLGDAHALNAFVMSSAAIPAFLLARRVTNGSRLAYVVAVLTVCLPWIVLASFLMTESVAYPAFLWAILALHNAVVAPRPRNDVLLLVAIGVAILARTQFAVLLAIVPLAILLDRFAPRRALAEHRILTASYGVLAAAGVILAATGNLSRALGTYSVTAEGNVAPSGMPRSLLEHLAPLGLGVGIVPFVLGSAWLLASVGRKRPPAQNAFAAIAWVAIVALLLEVTSYDLRFGAGRLHDRYLFYVVPLLLVAFVAMLLEPAWPRWAIAVGGALLALAFAFMPIVSYGKFNVDSPVAFFNERLLAIGGSENGAQLSLSFLAIVVMLLLLAGRRIAVAVAALAIVLAPVQTAAAFTRLLGHDGTSGRPLTLDQSVVFDWLDRKVGSGATVTMIPYPFQYGTYWENVAYWWNVEFWNASVRRAIVYETAFTGTPETFPTTALSFDRATGRANVSPSSYVAQAVAETRFRLAGHVLDEDRGVALIRASRPWRADWLAFDLYRDGWTIPRMQGTIRVFATPGQSTPERRYVTVSVRAPNDVAPRPFTFRSNAASWTDRVGAQPTSKQLALCVPPHGFADLKISAPRYSPIYGDPRSEASFVSYARSGGVLVTGIALADETSPC
jgi:Dolichyl-phosphate-mannose-protein mannosyltransferase